MTKCKYSQLYIFGDVIKLSSKQKIVYSAHIKKIRESKMEAKILSFPLDIEFRKSP